MFINNSFANDDNEPLIVQSATVAEESIPLASPLGAWSSLIPIGLMLIVFYFLLIRPQEKRRKALETIINGVKPGEQIITSSGIYGSVVKIYEDNSIDLEIAKGLVIKVLKSSILEITSRPKIEENKLSNKAKK